MADFFSDLFGGLTGQQVAPQQTIIPTNQLLQQSYGTLNGVVAPGLVGFNQALAPGLTDVQLGVTNQIDPSILANYRGANASILDQLNLGSSMSPELQNEITRNLLATNSATGFGASAGGVGGIQYQTAIDKQNLLRQRQQDALAAGTGGLAISNRMYDPAQYTQLGAGLASGIASDIQDVQAAQDRVANVQENIRRQNFASLINTGGRILGGIAGGVAGSFIGNPAGGAMAGSAIGGQLYTGSSVAGMQQPQSQQGGGFTSILSGLFGGGGAIGGPRYGIGGGQTYANQNGGVSTSIRAAPVQNF